MDDFDKILDILEDGTDAKSQSRASRSPIFFVIGIIFGGFLLLAIILLWTARASLLGGTAPEAVDSVGQTTVPEVIPTLDNRETLVNNVTGVIQGDDVAVPTIVQGPEYNESASEWVGNVYPPILLSKAEQPTLMSHYVPDNNSTSGHFLRAIGFVSNNLDELRIIESSSDQVKNRPENPANNIPLYGWIATSIPNEPLFQLTGLVAEESLVADSNTLTLTVSPSISTMKFTVDYQLSDQEREQIAAAGGRVWLIGESPRLVQALSDCRQFRVTQDTNRSCEQQIDMFNGKIPIPLERPLVMFTVGAEKQLDISVINIEFAQPRWIIGNLGEKTILHVVDNVVSDGVTNSPDGSKINKSGLIKGYWDGQMLQVSDIYAWKENFGSGIEFSGVYNKIFPRP